MAAIVVREASLAHPAFRAEVDALTHAYYRTTEAAEGNPPLDWDWPQYEALARQDMTLALAARAATPEAPLIGCALYVVTNHPHHRTLRVAECDTLAVDPEWRGRGVGRLLVAHAENILRFKKVQRVIHRHRHVYGVERPLFAELGFTPIETVWQREL